MMSVIKTVSVANGEAWYEEQNGKIFYCVRDNRPGCATSRQETTLKSSQFKTVQDLIAAYRGKLPKEVAAQLGVTDSNFIQS